MGAQDTCPACRLPWRNVLAVNLRFISWLLGARLTPQHLLSGSVGEPAPASHGFTTTCGGGSCMDKPPSALPRTLLVKFLGLKMQPLASAQTRPIGTPSAVSALLGPPPPRRGPPQGGQTRRGLRRGTEGQRAASFQGQRLDVEMEPRQPILVPRSPLPVSCPNSAQGCGSDVLKCWGIG